MADEIRDIIAKATGGWPKPDWRGEWQAQTIIDALAAAGFVIVPATSDLLRRGEGVKLHE